MTDSCAMLATPVGVDRTIIEGESGSKVVRCRCKGDDFEVKDQSIWPSLTTLIQ